MNTRDQIVKNIDSLIRRTGPLQGVLDRLEAADIRYGLYAGAHVAILTNNRWPADVDFLVHDEDIDKLKRNFPSATYDESESAIFIHLGEEDQIEFMGRASIRREGVVCPFRLTDLAVQRLDAYTAKFGTIKVVNPVDTLLLKAILRRGRSQGKHDLEDIQAMLAQVTIDAEYLKARMNETKAAELTAGIWHRFGVQV